MYQITQRLCMGLYCGLIFSIGCSSHSALVPRTITQPKASSARSGLLTADQLNVATFNIRVGRFNSGSKHWSNRRDAVISLIADGGYDVVGLQEALDFQLEEIQLALPQYQSYAVGRSDGDDDGETCAILFRKDRFIQAESGTLWFSKNPAKPGSKFAGTLFPRICSWVRLGDRKTSNFFYVYNTHLDSLSQSARKKSVHILRDQIAKREKPNPFIVMGDFNMELDNPAMRTLQNFDSSGARLQDAWASLFPNRKDSGTYHKFKGGSSGPKIDHILVSSGSQVHKASIDRRVFDGHYASDHYPVSAVVELW